MCNVPSNLQLNDPESYHTEQTMDGADSAAFVVFPLPNQCTAKGLLESSTKYQTSKLQL